MTTTTSSPLTSLRALVPHRIVEFGEALQIAEQQARRLIDLIADVDGVNELHIARMPRIKIVREDLPVSGMSYWNGQQWVIALSRNESQTRQRFTLLHEFKHIVDHGSTARLYPGNKRQSGEQQAEAAADYFAGCALVGKRELKSAWGNRIQRVEDLAHHFNVSFEAIRVRLAQTGLDVVADKLPTPRCARPVSTPRYQVQRFRTARPRYAQRRYA
ncbi:ImmA/IrrE family metallo-endopeptidase [Aeromicrobium sp. Root344]|uniref:ImmA/IrrE family metallo-endopeptidase n=1 Tax=Aeromicrobium sp. Root344 TaxID=1736521 RepID=UPI0009E7C537|nr:ImmA/IrrE family metallo-endopeptidase [Aeromicrobium sp. Root344]